MAGSGANATVTVSVAVGSFGSGLPAHYSVLITPSQACFVEVINKTWNSFSVVLTPPSGVTLAAGTFDVVVVA